MSRPSSPAPQPSWHFPFGPSSKYHQRERSQSHSTRFKPPYPGGSPSPSPAAPVLITERRAHRRAQSSLPNLFSPPGSDRAVSRQSNHLANYASAARARGSRTSSYSPITPLKSPPSSIRLLQDSPPYSDYFTDEDARSVVSSIPAPAVQQVLVRLAKLQSQLMRAESQSGHVEVDLVRKKLGELEAELRASCEMRDSGVFSGDEDGEDSGSSRGSHHSEGANKSAVQDNSHAPPIPPTPAFQQHNSPPNTQPPTNLSHDAAITPFQHTHFLGEMQQLLTNLRNVQIQLRQRCVEVRTLNERHAATLDEHEQQFEQLRSQNESLRADLGFEYSELLFLKLQLKALEVDVQSLGDADDDDDLACRTKRNRILAEMDRWRADWQDVHARFQRRKSAYGGGYVGGDDGGDDRPDRNEKLLGAAENNIINRPFSELSAEKSVVDTDWQLETFVRADDTLHPSTPRLHRRVTSLTITRVDSHSTPRSAAAAAAVSADANDDTIAELEEEKFSTDRREKPEALVVPTPAPAIKEPKLEPEPTPKPSRYVTQGTQTDVSMALLHDADDDSAHDDDDDDDDDVLYDTTDGHTDEPNGDLDPAQLRASPYDLHPAAVRKAAPPRKSAWQELCEGLASLSGMGDDRF